MPKGLFITVLAFFISFCGSAQQTRIDSIQMLDEIMVHAFEYEKPIKDIPTAVSVYKKRDFDRYNNTSLLPVLNSAAGVRMEERSPGSYRLSVRGSSLRSPFGIRNVKIYWNDLPFTDPGGNTYLNILDFSSIGTAEVIKGPGASLYGAGTGGVLLLNSSRPNYNQQQIQLSTTIADFGTKRVNVGFQNSSEKFNSTIQYARQQSDGYRVQSKMRRDVFTVQGNLKVDTDRIVSINLLYADLYYQTPGALTKIQYDTLPEQARPAAGPNRGAVEQNAAIYNKTFYTAISQEYQIDHHWSNRTGAYGTFTKFENSAIRNYERKTEQSFGMRSVTTYVISSLKINIGGEYQYGFSPIRIYDNNSGLVGANQSDDEITSTSSLVFAQFNSELAYNFFITAGASYNFYTIDFNRLLPSTTHAKRNFTPVFSPRIAVLKKLTDLFSVYGSFSQGFSPPTVADLYPSTAVFDQTLQPERGNNFEAGIKGSVLNKSLTFDLAAYTFQLKQTIVSRRDTTKAGDPEYFINAGSTVQKGLEVNVSWSPQLTKQSLFNDVRLWSGYTLNHFRFKDYIQGIDTLIGKKLTGTPSNTWVAGLDLQTRIGVYANVTFNYVDRIPLNDANSVFANAYTLLAARIGYRVLFNEIIPLDIFCGVDNAFNAKYSLGNDLNAVGNRFYNAAPSQNFFVGLKANIIVKKR